MAYVYDFYNITITNIPIISHTELYNSVSSCTRIFAVERHRYCNIMETNKQLAVPNNRVIRRVIMIIVMNVSLE